MNKLSILLSTLALSTVVLAQAPAASGEVTKIELVASIG